MTANKLDPSKPSAIFTTNFFMRVVSSIVLGGGTLWMLVTESPYVAIFMTILSVIVLIEWSKIVFTSQFSFHRRVIWLGLVSLYMISGILGFYEFYNYSPLLGLSLLFIIWSTDIGAYFTGRLFGGAKLAPSISPGKTWSGAIGGFISALITALMVSTYLYDGINWWILSFFSFCSILGQIGDLFESKVKRVFQVKDSGNLLPGHGGFIDRLDSLFIIGFLLLFIHCAIGFDVIFRF